MYRKDWIGKWAEFSPSHLALKEYETNRTLTYQQLNKWANYLAHQLTTHYNLTKGDRLMVIADHGLEYVALFSAAQKTGIILVPVNVRLAPPEIDYRINDCAPQLIVCENKYAHKLNTHAIQNEVLSIEVISENLRNCATTDYLSTDVAEDDPIFILYTSGTTGTPKGALYTHKMLLWNSLNTSQSLEISPSDQTITVMPAFHTGGWNVLLAPMLHRGASVGILKKFDGDTILKLLEQEQSNLFMGVPTMLKMMMESSLFEKTDLSSIRYFIVGGEALPLEVIQQWHTKGVKIRQGYGLTEAGPNITSLHQDDAERKIGSIGRPNFYVDFKLVNEAGTETTDEQIGELCVKGPIVTPGYWKNPEATTQSLKEGWFYTGDLARVDNEGYLYIIDRKKSMFISGGENVYPAEVEKLLRSMDEVDEAAVIGVPDSKWGEVGKAFITLKKRHQLTIEAIEAYCIANMAKFKVPKYIEILVDMPKNDSGKIDRNYFKNLKP